MRTLNEHSVQFLFECEHKGSMLGKVSIEIVGDGHAGGEKIPMRMRAGWRLCKDHDEIEGLVAAGQSWC